MTHLNEQIDSRQAKTSQLPGQSFNCNDDIKYILLFESKCISAVSEQDPPEPILYVEKISCPVL